MKHLAFAALVLAACGGDDGGGMVTADAAQQSIDAAVANKVVTVTCPATVAGTVTTTDGSFSYSPMATTISVNGIVKFVTSLEHNVVPNPLTTTDPGLAVGFNKTVCLQFTATGTYGFGCGPHGFVGTVTVQ